MSTPPIARAIVENTDVARTAEQVQSAITGSAETDTVLVEASVEDRSPRVAKQIADGLARELPRLVDELEVPSGAEESPVNVSVTAPPRLPTSPAFSS